MLIVVGIMAQDTLANNSDSNTITSTLDLTKVFRSAPVVYSILLGLSLASFILWLYSLMTLRFSDMMPREFVEQLREQLGDRQFEAALLTCRQDDNFVSPIIASGISHRIHGSQVIIEAIQNEGKRCGTTLWQRISLLNDIASIAPMFGLLGTVLGMFYAFYDTSRTQESITGIFDGLGMAIGTTVAGLIVAIIATIFYTTLKFRVVKLLNRIESESLTLGSMIAVEASHINDDNTKGRRL